MYGQKIGYNFSFENEGGEEMEVRGAWQATVHGVAEEPGRLQSMGSQELDMT